MTIDEFVFKNAHNNFVYFMQYIVAYIDGCETFHDLKPFYDSVIDAQLIENIDYHVERSNENPYSYSLKRIGLVVGEIISNVASGKIAYSHDYFTEFSYLHELGRILSIYTTEYFVLEKHEVIDKPELLKTYNRLLLIGKL